jgi:hypothetical protein
MKLTLGRTEGGGTLLITIISCVLVGTVLSSYLRLVSARNHGAMRALAWNTAIPVLEAGIEEALTHLHEDGVNYAANAWTPGLVNGQTVYQKERELPDGSRFFVTISNAASASPVIYSKGYVKAPLRDDYVERHVRLSLTNPPSLFTRAIAAEGAVRLSGGSVVDGYDSSLGGYDAVTNRTANGGVATNSKQTRAIDVGSGRIYGTAVTGHGGTVSVAGGAVGDLDWESGIQPGWTNNDMNVQFQPNSPPGEGLRPTTTQVGSSNITYLSSRTYKDTSFVSNDRTRPMIVTGDAVLWVTGDFIVAGSGYVYIEPGASLKLYVGGTGSISGGGIVNGTGSPANLSYIGLPSSKTLNYNGNANFIGTINAPQADFMLSGGASVFGAIIANTFTSSGGSSVHYDQATSSKGIFMVTAWREL